MAVGLRVSELECLLGCLPEIAGNQYLVDAHGHVANHGG